MNRIIVPSIRSHWRVVNALNHIPTPDDVYIGRPGPWGNPYMLGVHGARNRCCDLHMLLTQAALKVDPHMLDPLRRKMLVCHCAPHRCHGLNYIILLRELYPHDEP